MPTLAPLPSVEIIHERLQVIYPEGTPNRNYCTREIAAKTIFVMLYIGAVEGTDKWLRPDQVTRMTDAQAARAGETDRLAWEEDSLRPAGGHIEGRWYAANTREPIRDETLREGLVRTGAVKEREGLPTTSPKPRYALKSEFASLLHPALKEKDQVKAIQAWQENNLSKAALARITIMRRGAVATEGKVLVEFPSGETRRMEPGPSSMISKAVIEEFAPRFLQKPGVIWLSESRNQVVARDDDLAQAIGLRHPTRPQPPRHHSGRLGAATRSLRRGGGNSRPCQRVKERRLVGYRHRGGFQRERGRVRYSLPRPEPPRLQEYSEQSCLAVLCLVCLRARPHYHPPRRRK